jgi:DNA-binding IclR family transcriptional regulator
MSIGTTSRPPSSLDDPGSILIKAFELLRTFDADRRVMTLAELSRAAGMPKSTVHRILGRLLELDAIERHEDGYAVSLRLAQLAATTPAAGGRDLAMPVLAWLHRWTGQTVHYGVLRDRDVVFLEKLTGRDSVETPARVGGRLPAGCTAIGKALMAWEDLQEIGYFARRSPGPTLTAASITDVDQLMTQLEDIRRTGLAREENEAQDGLSCVGAPIVVKDCAIAAISISFPTDSPIRSEVEQGLRRAALDLADQVDLGLKNGREHWFPGRVRAGLAGK